MDDPICSHVHKGVVRNYTDEGSSAVTSVCDLPECIAEAIRWVNRMTLSTSAVYIADGA